MIGLEYRGYRVEFLGADANGFYGEACNDKNDRLRFYAREKDELEEAFHMACNEAIDYQEYCAYSENMAQYLQAQYFDEAGYHMIDF